MNSIILGLIFTILNYLDYRSTYLIMNYGGVELNPFMNKLISLYGFKGFLFFKIVINIFICLFASNVGLIILIIAYSIIVLNNTYHLFYLKSNITYKDLYYPFY